MKQFALGIAEGQIGNARRRRQIEHTVDFSVLVGTRRVTGDHYRAAKKIGCCGNPKLAKLIRNTLQGRTHFGDACHCRELRHLRDEVTVFHRSERVLVLQLRCHQLQELGLAK